MKNGKSIIFYFIFIAMACLGFFFIKKNSLRSPFEVDSLLVGTCDDYPPYTFQKDGRLVGFDIDLITEVAKRMSKSVDFKIMSFDLLLLELMRGSIHLVAAGLSPTEKRAEKVLFSHIYIEGNPFVAATLVGEQPISSVANLIDKRVGVNEGYTADQYMSQQNGVIVVRFENLAMALLALQTRKIDAFVTSQNSLSLYLKQHHDDNNLTLCKLPFTEEICAFALSKHYPELLKTINNTLIELDEDGTLEDLKQRWGLI